MAESRQLLFWRVEEEEVISGKSCVPIQGPPPLKDVIYAAYEGDESWDRLN